MSTASASLAAFLKNLPTIQLVHLAPCVGERMARTRPRGHRLPERSRTGVKIAYNTLDSQTARFTE